MPNLLFEPVAARRWAGCLLLFGFNACNSSRCPDGGQDRGFFSDAPPPTLCASDHLDFSPRTAVLRLDSRSGVDQGGTSGVVSTAAGGNAGSDASGGEPAESGAGDESLTMAVLATDEDHRALDTVNVDVWVCGGDGLIRLAREGGACDQVTETRLQCPTTSAGVAQFRVVHARNGSGGATICARSGRAAPAQAEIDVVGDGGIDLVLEVDPLGYGESTELSCGRVACDAALRVGAVSLTTRDPSGRLAEVVSGRPATVTLDARRGSGAWLSLEPSACTAARASSLDVPLARGGIARPFYVCADLTQTSFDLTARLQGHVPARQTVMVVPVPVTVEVSGLDNGGAGGAGGSGGQRPAHIEVTDCAGNPLPGIDLSVGTPSQDTVVLTTDSLGSADHPTDADALAIGVADPLTGRVLRAECPEAP